MKANVLSLTAVAADGSVFRTGTRARKSVAGLDLTSLLIGSEGTLAIVTEAVLRVVPLPEVTVVVCTPFATVRSACQAVNDAALAGLPLAAAELLDARMAGVVGSQSGGALLPAGAVPHVLWKLAGAPGAVAEAAGRLRAVALAAGATDWQCSSSAETAEALWEARKAALFSVQASSPECSVLTTDVCVPTSELPALLENFEAHYALQAGAAARGALPAAFAVAHAGDGNAHHFLSFAPGTPQEAAAKGLADWLALEAIRLQGTCTGEHGVGSGKRKYLLRELGEGNARVAGLIKAALDPLGILNPGKKHA
jgi:D-lactate dehydrogenase (cytochrome)